MLPGRNLAIMFALIFIFAQFAKGGMNQYEQSDDFVNQSGFNFAIMPCQDSGRNINVGSFDLI